MAPEKKDQSKEGTEQGSQTENNAPNQGTTGGQQTENTARSIGTSEQSGTGSEDAETRPTREQLSPQQPSRTRGRATSPLPPPSAPIDIPRRRETNVRDFESPMSRSEVRCPRFPSPHLPPPTLPNSHLPQPFLSFSTSLCRTHGFLTPVPIPIAMATFVCLTHARFISHFHFSLSHTRLHGFLTPVPIPIAIATFVCFTHARFTHTKNFTGCQLLPRERDHHGKSHCPRTRPAGCSTSRPAAGPSLRHDAPNHLARCRRAGGGEGGRGEGGEGRP
ncbi:hypothetical protein F4780DRAFT_705972 [Xylariomycetidae sp. FL0641]|nr:hypothetical protein F4780DRAFT_705972 [Xylariomycetidae sp. FL0641]